MGQRHQLFVVASIAGRYRGLAAVHHQWLYGRGPLKACLRLLHIFSEPLNNRLLRHELLHAESLTEDEWTAKRNWEKPIIPFPFITTCLVLGTSYSPTDASETSNVSVEPFNLEFDEGDNNDGITVIDITEPAHPRYCFLALPYCETQAEPMIPLRAIDYLSAYYPRDKQPEGLVESFERYGLISTDSLKATWPRDDWGAYSEESTAQSTEANRTKADADDGKTAKAGRIRSLRKLSLAKTIDECLVSPNFTDDLDDVKLLPDFFPAIENRLRRNSEVIDQSPYGKQVLSMVLEGKTDVDLSSFKFLTDEEALQLVVDSQLEQTMETLDLSGSLHITSNLLSELGRSCEALKKIYLFNTPQIPLDAAYSALETRPDIELIHSGSFLEAFRPVNPTKIHTFKPHPDYSTFAPVIQILWVSSDGPELPRSDTGAVRWTGLDKNTTEPSRQGRPKPCWFSGNCFRSPRGGVVPLTDMRLSCKDTSRMLGAFLNFVLGLDSPWDRDFAGSMSTFGCGAAKTFAMMGEGLYEVRPIPARLYRYGKACYHSSGAQPPEFESIREGEWTVVVTSVGSVNKQEKYKAVNYAFVTRETDTHKLLIVNFPEFVKRTGLQQSSEAIAAWEREAAFLQKRTNETGMGFDVEVALEEEVTDLLAYADRHEEIRKENSLLNPRRSYEGDDDDDRPRGPPV